MFFQAPLAKTAAGGLILEFISAAIGAHAYSIARRNEKEILATVRLPAGPAPSAGLPRAIPVGLAAVLAAGCLALLVLGLLLPDYSHVDQSTARVSLDSLLIDQVVEDLPKNPCPWHFLNYLILNRSKTADGLTTPCGTTVAPKGNCTFQVTFTPTISGTIKGAVGIAHDALGSPQVVGPSGTGQ